MKELRLAMKVMVVVVTYNFEPWMERCLGSLRRSEHPADVVVVDNNSSDRTVELLRANYPEVELLTNKCNLGFGRANNQGLSLALARGYDAVFLLNQDAWIEPATIGTLCRLSEEHPEYGILSPLHLTGTGNRLDHGFAVYTHLPEDALPCAVAEDDRLRRADFINAAFWFLPRHTLQVAGGFSPLFYHYGEDKDYVNRMRYHGLLVGFSPLVRGWHDRERRQPSRKSAFRSERVYLLSEYANPCYSLPRAFAFGVLAGAKKALLALLRLRLRDALAYVGIAFRLLWATASVVRLRKLVRARGPHFI